MSEFTDALQKALAPAYTLVRELTGGGMSRVFVADDVALGRQVVVKVLPPELAAGVNHERFRREIQVAAALQHPHVVPLLSAGEQGSLIWYTMPYIQGHSVREGIARGERFAVRDVVRILRNVADALDYAHGRGVIHRDIKPGNVLLLGAHALVTDFGVSKAISAALPSSGSTSAGVALGTPAYMAPEQLAADPAADHRLDLYALGLLGYELLTGKVPFKEDSPQKTMAAQLTRDPAPIEDSRGDVPPALTLLLRRLLEKLPDDRPADAATVVKALDDIALSSGPSLAPLRSATRPSAMRVVLIGAAGVAVVASAWLLGQHEGAESGVASVRDSLLAAESTQTVVSAASILTREDSMAIARAVSNRIAAQRPAPAQTAATPAARSADSVAVALYADSVRVQIQRMVLDSFFRAEAIRMREIAIGSVPGIPTSAGAAPSAGTRSDVRVVLRREGPRRVALALPRTTGRRPDLDAIVGAVADSLRAHLGKGSRYHVIASDSVASVLRESRTVNSVQEKLAADVIVSISLSPGTDSVTRMVLLRDLTAARGFNTRMLTHTGSAKAPADGISELMPDVLSALREMEAGMREGAGETRQTPRPGPRPVSRPPEAPTAGSTRRP